MKLSKHVLVVAATALALVGGTVTSAQAAPRPVDVTGYSVKDLVFGRSGCQNVKASAKVSAARGGNDFEIVADLSQGKYIYGSADFEGTKGATIICDSDGFGKVTIGPAEVYGETASGDFYDYTDNTKSVFYVRALAKTSLKATRTGKKITLTAKATRYSARTGGYAAYSPKKAKFQIRSGSTWKTIKTVNLKKGKAVCKLTHKTKASYRFAIAEVATATGATSKTVRK